MDFSQAERLGFCQAYVHFWSYKNSTQSPQELYTAAERLLKGCREHFRAGITRLKRSALIIPPEKADLFETMAMGLLDLSTVEQFLAQAAILERIFPSITLWIRWWMQPGPSSMLFSSYRTMDPVLWTSLPDTTNAEEAMHSRIYHAVGKSKPLLEGLEGMLQFILLQEKKIIARTGKFV